MGAAPIHSPQINSPATRPVGKWQFMISATKFVFEHQGFEVTGFAGAGRLPWLWRACC